MVGGQCRCIISSDISWDVTYKDDYWKQLRLLKRSRSFFFCGTSPSAKARWNTVTDYAAASSWMAFGSWARYSSGDGVPSPNHGQDEGGSRCVISNSISEMCQALNNRRCHISQLKTDLVADAVASSRVAERMCQAGKFKAVDRLAILQNTVHPGDIGRTI